MNEKKTIKEIEEEISRVREQYIVASSDYYKIMLELLHHGHDLEKENEELKSKLKAK